jgi:hypothetical protein
VYFSASNLHGSGVVNNVFNFNQIIIPANVVVRFTENYFHGPVYWLAKSDVTIAGTLDLSGDTPLRPGIDPSSRRPTAAGSGGFPGGVGGSIGILTALQGGGPGGGAPASSGTPGQQGFTPSAGVFAGSNNYLTPLIGGSGGGGNLYLDGNAFGAAGGGGGGAILIASSTSIVVNGLVAVNGSADPWGLGGSYGSGGAIHLIAPVISVGGALSTSSGHGDPPGFSRVEACTYTGPPVSISSTPTVLVLPSAPPPSVQVTSVNGAAITENPFSFPDIAINTPSAVPVVITAHQVPVGTVPTLYIFSEAGEQNMPCASGLQGTLATSTCTINLTFPFGGSRGYVKANWNQ